MKVAHIMPPLFYPNYVHVAYFMALGQWLVKDEGYKHMVRFHIRNGSFCIVDNGAAEPREERVEFWRIVEEARDIGADEIVMPDTMLNADRTLEDTKAAMYLVPKKRRMVVPQGQTWEEWQYCLEALFEEVDFASIGLGKFLEKFEGGRVRALQILRDLDYLDQFHIHLLGCGTARPCQELERAVLEYNDIRGVDTGAAAAWAQNDQLVSETNVRYSLTDQNTLSYIHFQINTAMIEEAANAHYRR